MERVKIIKKVGAWLLVIFAILIIAGIIGTSLNSLMAFGATQLTMIILSGLVGHILDLKKSQQYSLLIFAFLLSFMLPGSQAATAIILLPAVLRKLKLIV